MRAGGIALRLGVVAAIAAVAALGCDDSAPVDRDRPADYGIAQLNVETVGEGSAPGDQRLKRWFEKNIDHHDGPMSMQPRKGRMQARLTHRTRVHRGHKHLRVVVQLEARIDRRIISASIPMQTLRASASVDQKVDRRDITDKRREQLGDQLAAEAVERVAEQLQLHAAARRDGPQVLIDKIADDSADPADRTLAVEVLVSQPPEEISQVGAVLEEATDAHDDQLALAACRAMVELEVPGVEYVLDQRAAEWGRRGDYDRQVQLLEVMGRLDAPWISIYLQTVADAHQRPRVRNQARSLIEDE